jgi:hypothetical protein
MAPLIIGVAALGFNLRGPITSLPPVYPELQSRLGLSNFAASLVPVVAQRLNGQRALAVSIAAGLAAGLAGALYAPLGGAVAWVLILGVSQGAALALAIFFTIARAPDPVAAASLSSLAQAVRLPGGERRPARAGLAALRDRQLGPAGGGAIRAQRRPFRRGPAGWPAPGTARRQDSAKCSHPAYTGAARLRPG